MKKFGNEKGDEMARLTDWQTEWKAIRRKEIISMT
jgi:hypothetical protein